MKGPGFGERHWEVRVADGSCRHPCRHCDQPIDDDETFIVEPAHPWIAVHTECIELLAWSLRQNLRNLEDRADQLPPDEVLEGLLGQAKFLEGVEGWCAHVTEARRTYEELVSMKLDQLGVESKASEVKSPRRPLPRRRDYNHG